MVALRASHRKALWRHRIGGQVVVRVETPPFQLLQVEEERTVSPVPLDMRVAAEENQAAAVGVEGAATVLLADEGDSIIGALPVDLDPPPFWKVEESRV
jgi:hypothetical protein